MKRTATIILWSAVAAALFFAGRGCGRQVGGGPGNGVRTVTRIDTVVVRDTLRDTVLVPVERRVVRVDTVFLAVPGDTVKVEVAVPVERKVYSTDDYRAVVEGFRPELIEMELYRKTALVTRETMRTYPSARWGIGIQAGYGFGPKGAAPYVGIGIQYSVITW